LGQALFTIVSAVAQLERDLIRERVSAGIRNARESGKKLGRPMRVVDRASNGLIERAQSTAPNFDRPRKRASD
jgi:putative DNA-invertase from lambdoid prophage Rac